jgi:opacity protein-like surface antigen
MRRLIAAAAFAALAMTSLTAHHSFSATYEISKQVTLDGAIAQFVYRNPHSFVHLDAPDAKGTSQRWATKW